MGAELVRLRVSGRRNRVLEVSSSGAGEWPCARGSLPLYHPFNFRLHTKTHVFFFHSMQRRYYCKNIVGIPNIVIALYYCVQ